MSLFNNKTEKQEEVQLSNSSNIIGKGTVINGDLETYGNIRIDGKVVGNIRSKSKVALGDGSVVEGNIFSQNAEVSGEVKGKLEISDILILKPSSTIHGDIYAGRLIIESGATFVGNCRMGEKGKDGKLKTPSTFNGKSESGQNKEKAAQATTA